MILESNTLFSPTQIKNDFSKNRKLFMEFAPCCRLRQYIYCYWISPVDLSSENNKKPDINNELVIPDGCIDILFRINTKTKELQVLVIGIMDAPTEVNFEYDIFQTFGIRFFPGVLYPFFKYPLNDFTNKITLLDDVIDDVRRKLGEELINASTINEMVSSADKYFSMLLNNSVYNVTLNNALHLIYKSKGNISIKDISNSEVISERQIRRIFNNWIGINPKTFCRIVRFQNILKNPMLSQEINWINLSLESGYYDQTHFIKEFKEFSGFTPDKFFEIK